MPESEKSLSLGSVDTEHPDYTKVKKSWAKIRDCMDGEDVIKGKKETYLPRPSGMKGDYADAYDGYIERAHFPLITSYALAGALGIVITKLPEFNVPPQLKYIIDNATKDNKSLSQLFLDIVQYKAEDFVNWKTSVIEEEKDLTLGVLKEARLIEEDIFSHETEDVYRVLQLDKQGNYETVLYDDSGLVDKTNVIPNLRGKTLKRIPLFLAGSINNSFDMQPIPLISVANCSVQIYRKEADLANSEYLSCNPTLCVVGATNDEDLPNVVGSSVMIVLPNEQARIFYTMTDTAALSHVKEHISDLYDEAIRHGVAILDTRKGVEAAESLRIRQSTQSASVYSIFLSAMNAINHGLITMCEWGGFDKTQVLSDAPSSLTQGIPDSLLMKELKEGYNAHVVPLEVIHRYLVYSGLLDQKVGYQEYLDMLKAIPENVGKEEKDLTITNKDGSPIVGEKETPK
jgi:hypothetical protein